MIESSRRLGFKGEILLISEERILPYLRPPLSKCYLTGRYTTDWLLYRSKGFYQQHEVATTLGSRVDSIDRGRQMVESLNTRIQYDWLFLATGARARRLGVPGDDLPEVVYLRGVDDAHRLSNFAQSASRAVIIGGGFIGLEVAAVLCQAGHRVTILVAGDKLMSRFGSDTSSVGAAVPSFFQQVHTAHGVAILFNVTVAEFRKTSSGAVDVVTEGHAVHSADFVVVGVGAIPNVELAVDAGIVCADGILVDEYGVSSDPRVLSAGDCARHPNAWRAEPIRLETVHNAVEQPRSAAAHIVGIRQPYRQIPWVWSDQYDYRVQGVGFADGADLAVLRGDLQSGRFGVLYFAKGALTGAEFVNRPGDFGACRRMMNAGASLTVEQAGDASLSLQALIPRHAAVGFDEPWVPRPSRPHPVRLDPHEVHS